MGLLLSSQPAALARDGLPLAHRLVALIPTRRVSEGFCGIVRPSLTLRVVMFPLPAANPLKQQALTLRVGMTPLPRGHVIRFLLFLQQSADRFVCQIQIASQPQ
jgi:hypothetical protein